MKWQVTASPEDDFSSNRVFYVKDLKPPPHRLYTEDAGVWYDKRDGTARCCKCSIATGRNEYQLRPRQSRQALRREGKITLYVRPLREESWK
jgi:hypothetical protein